jgi:DHA1 family multidrug resistance protein-like MFS transporter
MPHLSPQSADDSLHPRWQRTLYILFIAQLFTAIGFSSIFPFLPLYVEELGAVSSLSTEFLAGLVFSVQAFTMMIASPFWGALADRYGRKLMVERAMFGGAVILLLMAFARSAEELVLLRAIQGLITGTIAAANALAASIAPRNQTGYAMGLLQVGMSSGVALGPLVGGAIADAYSYSAAFYVTAGMLFIAGLLVWWGVEEDTQGLPGPNGTETRFSSSWRQILTSPGVPVTYSLRFLSQLGRTMILPIAPVFIQTLMKDSSWLNTFTGLVVGVSAATTTLSAGYLGRLGDRIGPQRIVVNSAMAAALFYLLHSLASAGWQLLVLQALVGITLGGIVPSISAMLARYTDSSHAGAVYGLDNSIDAASRSIAPLLGATIAFLLGMRATFAATAVLFLLLGLLASRKLPRQLQLENS